MCMIVLAILPGAYAAESKGNIFALYFKNNGPRIASVWVNGKHQGCVNGGGDTRWIERNGFSTLDSGLQPDGTRNPNVHAFGGWEPSDPLEVVATTTGEDGKEIRTVILLPQGNATEGYVWFGEGKAGPPIKPSEIEFAKKTIPCGHDVRTGATEKKKQLELRKLRGQADGLRRDVQELTIKIEELANKGKKSDSTEIAEVEKSIRDLNQEISSQREKAYREKLGNYNENISFWTKQADEWDSLAKAFEAAYQNFPVPANQEGMEDAKAEATKYKGYIREAKKPRLTDIPSDPSLLSLVEHEKRRLAELRQKPSEPSAETITARSALESKRSSLAENLKSVETQITELGGDLGQIWAFEVGNRGAREALMRKETEKRSLLDNLDLGEEICAS
jgi:hypothetical protein